MSAPAERRPGRIRRDLKRRLLDPVADQLTQGLSPDAVALTLALGLWLAVIPVVGATTILCFLAALAFRLNQPLMMGINYLSGPLQILLLVPFLRLGRILFGASEPTPSLSELARLVAQSPVRAIQTFWVATAHGVVAWLLVGPFLFAALFLALRPVLRAAARRLGVAAATRGRRPAPDADETTFPNPEESGDELGAALAPGLATTLSPALAPVLVEDERAR